MPIPKPNANETESNFMARCMDNTTMLAEYPDSDQRVAVCLSSYNDKKEIQVTEEFETSSIDIKAEIKAYEEDEKGYFSGYGSIFGNKDLGNDVMVEGAFAKSIASKGAKGVKLLYQHKADEPIGVFEEIIEDPKGLKVKGRLAMGTQRGREVYELMKMGAIDGLSIGYRVNPKGQEYDDRRRRRLLKEVDLMEISAVTFPMNQRARISAVKSDERTVRDWEGFFRDESGLSRKESKMAASAVYKALSQRDVGEEQSAINAIKNLTSIIKEN
tara:strand:- start:1152 stop:1967 length:816 start_codon:yes stop_codon:yes gene_type:complete